MGEETTPSAFVRITLAAALLGAAVIHFAMVPQHMSEWAPEGVAFIATGWVQVALAVVVIVRPRRWMLTATLLTSAIFIGAWTVTRVWGPPFGPGSGLAQPSSFVDLACVALEAVAIVVALCALWRPRLGATWNTEGLVIASIIPVAVLVLATSAVASPSAAHHVHGGNGCAEGYAPNPALVSSDGHAHDTRACVLADDKGFSALSNGHHHAIRNDPLDAATQAELDRQLDLTRQVAAKYPTLKDAKAAGYRPAGGYSPGLGLHMTGRGSNNFSGTMTDDNLLGPGTIIYAGLSDESPIAGFMYLSISKIEPVGFVGTNDTWHYHTNVCVKFSASGIEAPFGADREDVTKEMCDGVGGAWMPITTWMVHVWSVPGWENPNGVFAEEHPRLGCSDGTYHTVPRDMPRENPDTTCASGAPGDPTADGWSPLA